MLTFFRRIRKGLLGEGATSKYLLYAIGEILLVMVGILLALQVNNWNQDRADRQKEILLLKEINSEFIHNKEELERTTWFYENRVKKNCIDFKELFPIAQSERNIDTLINLLRRSCQLVTSDLSMGSISTLINTSSFDIISNEELRSLLLQWEDLVADYFEREVLLIDYTTQVIIPYLAKRIPQPYRPEVNDKRVDLSFVSTIEFENLINDRLWYTNTLLQSVQGEQSQISNALNRIIVLSGGHQGYSRQH